MGGWVMVLAVLVAHSAAAQVRTWVLGDASHTWKSGGGGIEPVHLIGQYAAARLDTGNVPGDDIEFDHRPGWISPRFFDGRTNIASMVLAAGGSIKAPNALSVQSSLLRSQLIGIVNGDHSVAFERKPTLFNTQVPAFGIWIVMDFSHPIGIERMRFYPRNTVVADPDQPFQKDYLRGYEVWVNPRLTDSAGGAPDILVARVPENDEPVVELPVEPQYVRLVKLRSITETPFEIDEVEVYGTGYLEGGTYYSDLIDLGGRATVGPINWEERSVGDSSFSQVQVQVRTGNDDTPIRLRVQRMMDAVEVSPEKYWSLEPVDRLPPIEDAKNWSPWKSLEKGALATAPGPRRFIQFQFRFRGRLFDTREVSRLQFQYLIPPLADTLRGEVFPRLADAEKPATFRYTVLLRATGQIQGFDRLEVDTVVPPEKIHDLKINGNSVDFSVESISKRRFQIAFPLITADQTVLEFQFDIPVFRFGTTFSGRAYNSRFPALPQRVEPGQAADFGPGDTPETSDLSVKIPKPQIGRLVGEVAFSSRVLTPNGDGVNDEMEVFFNLLQLVKAVPVSLELFDLAGRRVRTVFAEERGIGPASYSWDGRRGDGALVQPGTYLWVLRVKADAFEERHSGVIAVVY